MKLKILISVALFLVGCASDVYSPSDYGYHYTHTTPMGIMYRVDGGGTPLDPGQIDWQVTYTAECAGISPPFDNILVISTDADANPYLYKPVEGFAWQATENRPAMIVINSIGNPGNKFHILAHEFIHILVGSDSHDHPAFDRCGSISG